MSRIIGKYNDLTRLSLCVATASLVAASYLLTYEHPASAAGFFLALSEQIQQNGFYTETIPFYTSQGIPFAYPPLGAYFTAFVSRILNMSLYQTSYYLGPFWFIILPAPLYFFFKEVTDRNSATVATIVLLTTAAYFQRYLAAGGIIRTPAAIFCLSGLWASYKLFTSHNRQYVIIATVLFGLTLLSHLVEALFFGITCLTFYVTCDRTRTGLVYGVIVAVGGLTVSSPWWITVIQAHGIDVLVNAAQSRSSGQGIGGLIYFLIPTGKGAFLDLFKTLGIVGAIYGLLRREWTLPSWLALTIIFVGITRYTLLVASLIGAVFLCNHLLPMIKTGSVVPSADIIMAVMLVTFSVGGGLLFVTDYAGTQDRSIPVAVNDDQRAAMDWAKEETSPTATFWVIGDDFIIDWWPFMSDRTVLIVPLGTEWTGTQSEHQAIYSEVASCNTGSCLRSTMTRWEAPDYVYVDTEEHPGLANSLNRSNEFDQRFVNDEGVIYRVNASELS